MARKTSSRRLDTTKTTKTGVAVELSYCRKCMKMKKPGEYFQAVDTFLDSNGLMSVCKDCVQDLLNKSLMTEITIEGALLRVCRILDVKYDSRTVESIRNSMEKAEEEGKSFTLTFGTYLMRLATMNKSGSDSVDPKLTFIFQDYVNMDGVVNLEDIDISQKEYLENFWGKNLNLDDYEFLEGELAQWQSNTKLETYNELVLVKEICHQQNAIRKMRLQGESSATIVKFVEQLQKLMKDSGLTPNQQSIASGGKNLEAFGVFIKQIEEKRPAEIYEDKQKFKDIDGIEEYARKFITRPLKNFITGSRDFNVEELNKIKDDSEEDGEE